MTIYFEQGSGHEIEGEAIAFHGTRDGKPFGGAITREALEDLWAPSPPPRRWVDMFDTLEQQVFDLATAKAERGMFDHGMILIKSGDKELLS
jgi:hypothetical protein